MSDPAAPDHCDACGGTYKPNAAFCAQCGRRRHPGLAPGKGGDLRFVIRFYLAMLAIQAVSLIYVQVTDALFTTMVVASVAFVIVTIVVALLHGALVLPAYTRAGFSPAGYLVVLLVAPVVLVLVLGYVEGLSQVFGVHVPRELAVFDGHSLALAVLLIAIVPPLEEELAFRGLIYGALRRSMTVGETFLISSFAFALIHLSIPALLTHFPLGLYLCWLRHRSQSLWPPTFAHALHNFGVIVVESYGWL